MPYLWRLSNIICASIYYNNAVFSAFWCFCAEKSLAINRSSPLGEIRRLVIFESKMVYTIRGSICITRASAWVYFFERSFCVPKVLPNNDKLNVFYGDFSLWFQTTNWYNIHSIFLAAISMLSYANDNHQEGWFRHSSGVYLIC